MTRHTGPKIIGARLLICHVEESGRRGFASAHAIQATLGIQELSESKQKLAGTPGS